MPPTDGGGALVIDVRALLAGTGDGVVQVPVDVDAAGWIRSDAVVGRVVGAVLLERVEGGIVATVETLTGTRRMACVRCLTLSEGSFTLRGARCLFAVSPLPHEVDGSADATPGFDPVQQRLDLRPLLRQEVLLALPEDPTCSPDCRGLCPRCGANRNRETCSCPPEDHVGAPRPLSHLHELWQQHQDAPPPASTL